MSATILDSAPPARERPQDWAPRTADLDTTTDLHEENTTDLAPVTEDVTPAATLPHEDDAPRSSTPAPPQREETTRHEQRASAPARPVPATSMTGTATIAKAAAAPKSDPAAAPQRPPALAPGAVLDDRYLLEQVVGCGGTAVVFRARDMLSSTGTQPNAQVAIKTPRPELTDRARATTRLKHEYELASQLSHPNIVRVIELHDDPHRCFMALELIEGRLLSTLIRDWTMVSPPLARKILRDCASALAHAHKHGIVHGDFKPDNVFVTANEQIKIVDFGAAAAAPAGGSTRIHAGTPAYASPEVLGGQTPERRDDVFSFACVAYELLTGQHPFERHSSLQAREEGKVPPRAWSLSANQWLALLSALSWERAQRPADIETLMSALLAEGAAVSETVPIHAPAEAVASAELPADLMPPQRSWGFFIFIACAVIVTIIASQRKLDSAGEAPALVAPAEIPPPPGKTSIAGPPLSRPAASQPPVEQGAPTKPAEKKADPSSTPAATASTAALTTPAAAAPRAKPARMSEISFESRSVVTTESSVAAVFLVKRSQPLAGRVRVSWAAVSGTADAGIDFASNATGSIEFADGQAQRAIYVPLRNDLLKEGDETFTVRLQAPQQARVGPIARAEAMIRDDD